MANITVQQFQPSEIIAIFNDILAHQNNQASGKLVCIRGLYLKGNGIAYNGVYFDSLRDENSQVELPIKITDSQRKELTPGNLVDILGTLGRRITPKSEIKLELNVSRVEVVKEQVIDENEVKRIEYRQRKVEAGFKNVDAILESLLFNNTRPQVALIIAASSITLGDFEDGIRAARATIDFHEERVTLTQTKALCEKLKELDTKGYHAIAIVRGGGIDSTTDVDKPEVIEVVSSLKTPFISGVGHKPEKIFLRQVADKWTPTPQGLGQYFSELAETVNEKKNKSQAALTEQIKKQFKDQLEAGQKQNKELQEKLAKLTKTQEETQKQHKEQVDKANKQNEELQKKLTEITKANETAQKAHAEQLGKLQVQLKAQTEASSKQSKEFNESLKKMQETNGQLQKSMEKLTAQNTQANKDLNEAKDKARQLEKQLSEALSNSGSTLWKIIAIIAAIAFFAVLLLK